MKLVKCKRSWDERLYTFATKRYGRISNIGWYKMFMSKLDFIHDSYLNYISDTTNFEVCENFDQYKKRFSRSIINYRKASYRMTTKKGQEFDLRKGEYVVEPDWGVVSNRYMSVQNTDFEKDLKDYKYVSKFYGGFSFVEIAKEEKTSPTSIRNWYLKEIEILKNNKELKEILLDHV